MRPVEGLRVQEIVELRERVEALRARAARLASMLQTLLSRDRADA